MEDQRNWSDASFKTYGTPLSLPFPVRLEESARVRQAVVVSAGTRRGRRTLSQPAARQSTITVDAAARASWPAIGVGLAPGQTVDPGYLAELAPAHVRVELRVHAARVDGWQRLARAVGGGIPIDWPCM